MIRLLYCSQAKPNANSDMLEDILLASRKNNAALDVTGVLVHGGGMFMQVLEGPEAVVLRLYVKILDDKRHTDSRIIHVTPTSTRLFPNWTMGMIEAEPLSFEEVAHLRAHRVESVAGDAFTALMHKFNGLLVKADKSI